MALLAAAFVAASLPLAPGASAAGVVRQVAVTIRTADDRPVTGLPLRWWTTDGTARSSGCKATDDSGRVTFLLPVTEIWMTSQECPGGAGSVEGGPSLVWLRRIMEVPASGPISIDVGPAPEIVLETVRVQMPDGTPVFGAVIEPGDGAAGSYHLGGVDGGLGAITIWGSCPRATDCLGPPGYWTSFKSTRTDANGNAQIWRFRDPQPDKLHGEDLPDACYRVGYDDGELHQITTAGCGADPVIVELPYMPVANVESPPVDAVMSGSVVTVSVRAVDGTGAPIGGQTVSLTPLGTTSAAVASTVVAARCSPRLSGKTSSTGRVTFRICPDRTRAWRADGRSLVAAHPFTVLVRKAGSPGAPRTVKGAYPGDGTVIVSWGAPVSRGTSAITRYQVRWSTNRGLTWSAWKSTKLTRHTTPKSLAVGTTYLVQVQAVNASGGGATGTATVALPR